jgi:hypothetical protein
LSNICGPDSNKRYGGLEALAKKTIHEEWEKQGDIIEDIQFTPTELSRYHRCI